MKNLSLRLRLALFGALAILVALGLAAWGLSSLFAVHVERRAVAEMEFQLEQVLAGLSTSPSGLVVSAAPTDPRFNRPYGGLYWQVETLSGVTRSRSLWDAALDIPDTVTSEGEAHIYRHTGPNGEPLLAVERIVTLPPSLGAARVKAAVAMEATELSDARRAFTAALTPYLLLLGAVLIAAQFLQLSLGLRPLRAIGARIADLRSGKTRRMGNEWPSEMRPLAGEIDALLAAREADIERARHRAADLAHGLKTPLQALLGEAGRLRDRKEEPAAQSIEQIAGTMQRHVERELARTRASSRAAHSRTVIGPTIRQIVSVLGRTAQGEDIEWLVAIADDLAAAIDPADLSEAVGALAENAMRHARNTVRIDARREGAQIALSIRDDGPGIPEAKLASVVQRGKRLDESEGGTGLGLAIASEIAQAAGGSLSLENSAAGFTATIRLNAAQ